MYATFLSILLAMIPSASSPPPGAPALTFPVGCDIGRSCWVQKLFDHDAGPGRRDYRCGTLTTDGHDGVDIRLRTMAEMHAGFAVLASAAGTVLRTRDGEPDVCTAERHALDGKEAGNAVVIDHGGDWQTQYSHLRLGSIRVRPGERVAAGDEIGLIGLSGNSEYPHLHFTVRYRGAAVDPFVGALPATGCGGDRAVAGLWAPATARRLAYTSTAAIAAGLASDVPPRAVARRDPPPALAGTHAPLILWVDAMGAKAGDRQEFSIIGPDGVVVHRQQGAIAEGGLSWFAYSGRRAPATGWQKGRYVGRYTLQRGAAVVAEIEVSGLVR